MSMECEQVCQGNIMFVTQIKSLARPVFLLKMQLKHVCAITISGKLPRQADVYILTVLQNLTFSGQAKHEGLATYGLGS